MEQTEDRAYDAAEAKAFIRDRFIEQGDFLEIVDDETLDAFICAAMALDEAFMHETGADDGRVYDDDAAFDYMHEGMMLRFPNHRMYMLRLVEDYMDYNEAYLDSLGLIDWE